MKTHGRTIFITSLLGFLLLATSAAPVKADQVEMQNGDRYLGRVVSLNEDALTLQSEFLGKVTLPRSRIAVITLGPVAAIKGQAVAPGATKMPVQNGAVTPNPATNDTPLATLRNMGANTNLVEQIRGQFLNGAGGAANSKFDELLAGLSTGKIDMDNLRAQAKDSAEQLRQLKRESGGAADASLDVYLDILDNFLKETAVTGGVATNSPAPDVSNAPKP